MTLTKEQVTKLMILFNSPIKCGNCQNAYGNTEKCLYCDENNSELIASDEFTKEINELLEEL